MPPTDAQVMENWFPESNYIRLRRGYREHATGLDGVVRTLYAFDYQGTQKLLAFTPAKIFDVTANSTATQLKTGFTDSIWSTVTMNGRGLFFNGADTPQQYDGSAVTNNTFTGIADPTTLKHAHVHKERLFLWQAQSQTFYYGGNQAITGALQPFDLSFVRSLVGNIVAMETFTYDSGEGVDDDLVIFMSSGQVLVYRGSDPSSASNWALTGVYQVGCPLSPRAVQKFGGDVLVMTDDGYLPLSVAVTGRNLSDALTISDKINPSIQDAAQVTTDRALWSFALFTRRNMLLANIPQGASVGGIQQFRQFVMNTRSGAWTVFSGWNGAAWAVLGESLYFAAEVTAGSESRVYEAEVGSSDNGAAREGTLLQAYTGLGNPARAKKWNMLRPIFRTEGALPISIGLAVDFEGFPSLQAVESGEIAGSLWDVAEWDVAEWGGSSRQQIAWRAIGRMGLFGAVALMLKSASQEDIRYFGSTVLVEDSRQPLG